MSVLPGATETLVVALEWDRVLHLISCATRGYASENSSDVRFVGTVQSDSFLLMMHTRRPASFLVRVVGQIDPSPKGCIIFITYSLLPATRFFLLFWMLFLIAAGGVVPWLYDNWWMTPLFVAAIILVWLISWANFYLQKRLVRAVLMKVLQADVR